MSLRIVSLHIYPVKSCAGIAVEASHVDAAGLAHDRRWLVVSGGQFMTQRQVPALARVQTSLTDTQLRLRAPDMPLLEVALDGTGLANHDEPVMVWRDTFPARAESAAAAQWFSDYLQRPCRLLKVDVAAAGRATNQGWVGRWRREHPELVEGFEGAHLFGFADGYPVLVANQASLNELNVRLAARGKAPVPMDRFRPNLVLGGTDYAPYDEDHTALFSCVGDIRLALVKPCTRCGIPDVDQLTGIPGTEPGMTLTATRSQELGVIFGQNAIVDAPAGAILRVGDEVVPEWNF